MKGLLQLPDGGHVSYETLGSGPPLLLVSGLGGLASFWRDFAQVCSDEFTVILHDHRGTGASSRCDRPYSIASMAEDVLALCKHLKISQPYYVGHSTGGAIGQHLVCNGLLTTRALVLSATFARPCPYFHRLFESRLQVLQHMGISAYREHADLLLYPPYWLAQHSVTRANSPPHSLDADITQRRIQAVLAHDVLDNLTKISCPTLVIAARDDIVTPEYHSLQLAQTIPNAELILLPRGGHYLSHTEGPSYRRHTLNFLRSHA